MLPFGGVQRRQQREEYYRNKITDQLEQETSAKVQGAWKMWSSQSGSSAGAALKNGFGRGSAGTKRGACGGAGGQAETDAAERQKRRRTSRGEDGQTRLFSTEDNKAKAALEWLQNQSGQSTTDALLAQIDAWDEVLAGEGARNRALSLAKSHGIAVPRASQNSLRDGKDYQIIRDQERRESALAPLLPSAKREGESVRWHPCCGRWPFVVLQSTHSP